MAQVASILWLAALAWPGMVALRRWSRLDALERLAYGAPLGVVAGSTLLVPIASVLGLRLPVVLGLAALSLLAGIVLRRGAGERAPSSGPPIGIGIWLLLGVIVARWAHLSASALTVENGELWAGHVNVWGDWSQHLGDITNFAYGDNFPPVHPRLSGQPLAYHYLTSVTMAAMMKFGLSPIAALALHGFVFLILTTLAIFAFARRMSGSSTVAALALSLFLLGGGFGFWLSFRDAFAEGAGGWSALWAHPWERLAQRAGNFEWMNAILAFLLPQRATLYGLPLGLLSLTLLWQGAASEGEERGRLRPFVLAGVAAGLLPLAHLGTLLALALLTPFLFLLFPRRGWVAFFLLWFALAAPVFLLQQGSEATGLLHRIRPHPGWVASPDTWSWFWIKNLGVFLAFLMWALLDRELLSRDRGVFLWGFVALFAIGNLFVFQPWDWDNTKVLLYWYLTACVLVAARFLKSWRSARAWGRAGLATALLAMTLSGVLANLDQMLGRDRYRILTADEVRFADEVRRRTPPHAMFVVGLQHNHPLTVLGGRRVVLGFPGWLWSQGYDFGERKSDVRRILTLDSAATTLLAAYGVDYVVIGPEEREKLKADENGYRLRYPQAFRTGSYRVFDVRRR